MRHTPYPILIFAAGFGTRMRPLTLDRPKPLIPVGDRPMIDRALDLARAANCAPIVTNLHYKADMLDAHLSGTDVVTTVEHPDILDTGGGLRNAGRLLGSNIVMTLNPDAIWAGPNPLNMLAQRWDPNRMDALLMCVPIDRTVGRAGGGDFSLSADGDISRGGDMVYGGTQICKTDGLTAIREHAFSLNVLWDRMASEGRLFGVEYPGQWCDVGTPEGVNLATDLLKACDD